MVEFTENGREDFQPGQDLFVCFKPIMYSRETFPMTLWI